MGSFIIGLQKETIQVANIILLASFFALPATAQDTVSVDYSHAGSALVRLNQAVSTIQISNGRVEDQLVKSLGMRLERTLWSPAVWAQAGMGQYDFTAANPFADAAPAPGRDWGSDSPVLDNIIAQGAQPVICLSGEPRWDASRPGESGELDAMPANMSEYQHLVRDGLNHLKSKYPGIQYIEVWNEPDNTLTPSQYQVLYQNVSQAVQVVNAALPSGTVPFLVGGPAVYNPASAMMGDFISFVRANNLELDFLSWHEYVGNVWSDARTLQNELLSAGLNPNTPQLVTEWGYTSYNLPTTPSAGDLMSAAAYVAAGWSELETQNLASIVTPFPFAENDYARYSRSMFVPYQQNPADDLVFPLYNVYQMLAMAKDTLVEISAVSGGTASLFPLATEDSSGVALMLTNTAGSTVTINLNNLPSAFQAAPFVLTEYLVDATHSNFAYNQSAAGLQQIARSMENAASSFTTTLTMANNSVALLMLTPTAGSGPAVRLAYLRQPSNVVANANMAPPVEVLVQDATGATVTTAGNLITLALKGGTGLGGTLTVAAQHGVASFSNLTLSTVGSGYMLLASSPKVTPKTSKPFNVRAP